MRVQRSRSDVLPLTWEVPVTITACWLLAAVLVLPAGQGIAFMLAGEGFVWPRGTLVASVGGLVQGEIGQGLPRVPIAAMPSVGLVYGSVVICELLVCALTAWTFALWWRSMGPGAHFGIARRHDVARVLGTGNLRRRRTTIRPDLYPAHHDRLRR